MAAKHIYLTSINRWCILNVPELPDKEYSALLVFCHGAGEVGTTEADLGKLYYNGAPIEINNIITNPIDNKKWRFITLAIQDPNYDTDPAKVLSAIKELSAGAIPTYQAAFITGLSMGGDKTMKCISDNESIKLYSAGVPLSASGPINDNFANMKAQSIRIWGFHGADDLQGPHDKYKTIGSANGYNAIAPGFFRYTEYPGGHCCWNTYYSQSYREKVIDVNNKSYNVNIFEWMLLNKKGTTFIPMVQNSNNPSPVVNADAGPDIQTVINAYTELVGKGATSNVRWEFYIDAAMTKMTGSELTVRNQNSLTCLVSFAKAGTYYAKLTVYGTGTWSDSCMVTVTTEPIPPDNENPAKFSYAKPDGSMWYEDNGTVSNNVYKLSSGEIVEPIQVF